MERGREFSPTSVRAFDPGALGAVMRLARLADSVSASFHDHPDASVRRSAAILAARAHPILAGADVEHA